jgi:predicted enzyme related to lactoylglutathione lyase
MSALPDAFGFSVTVDDIDAAARFYAALYPENQMSHGVFAGIPYIAIMRDGETLVNIFQKTGDNPLQDVFPTLKVDSVRASQDRVKQLGGDIVIPSSTCPCTSAPFAVCVDVSGNQFMLKEPRTG